jgi:hypothetical protein
MLEPRRQLDLTPKPIEADAPGEIRRQNLDDDLALERRVASDEHAGHAAAAQLTLDLVAVGETRFQLFAKLGVGGHRLKYGHGRPSVHRWPVHPSTHPPVDLILR